jgi:hypothetical protein
MTLSGGHALHLPVSMKQVPATEDVALALLLGLLLQLFVSLPLLLLLLLAAAEEAAGDPLLPKTVLGMGLPCWSARISASLQQDEGCS